MSTSQHDSDKTRSFTCLAEGTRVDRYRILSQLGSGGMGDVYIAEDPELNRKVAIKFLSLHLCGDAIAMARFKREAQSVARLDHPNIVAIHEVGEFQRRPYIAMQYVEGSSLKESIAGEKLSFDNIRLIAKGICEGISAAHKAGIVHRDIKPANIVVGKDGTPKILDFGLADIEGTERLTKTGSTLGTLGYMSPEQAAGNKTDERSDLFSFGVVLYEMIAGQTPFRGNSAQDVLSAILTQSPEPLLRYRANTPNSIQVIVSKLLDKEPSLRYQTAIDVLTDLERLSRSNVSTPEHYPVFKFMGMRLKRRVVLSTLALILVAAVLLILQPWGLKILPEEPANAAANRLAILYLQNRGAAEDEYLSYGITEELIVDLARNGSIGVVPMRSIMGFRDSVISLEDIANRLDANIVLDGSITRKGDSIRVVAQLIRVSTQDVLWAERWEEDVSNLPRVESDLAQKISTALSLDRSRSQAAQIGSPDAQDAVAYDFYLRGKYTFEHRSDESDADVAVGLYERALQIEPSMTAARLGIAEILCYKGEYESARTELQSILEDATKGGFLADQAHALRLLSEVSRNQGRLNEAERLGSMAVSKSRETGDLEGEKDALWTLGQALQLQQRHLEAIPLMQRMVEINRQIGDREDQAEVLNSMGNSHFLASEFDLARPYYYDGLELAERSNNTELTARIMRNIGNSYRFAGQRDSAHAYLGGAAELFRLIKDQPSLGLTLIEVSGSYSEAGDYRSSLTAAESAAVILEEIGDIKGTNTALFSIASAGMNLGLCDSALAIFYTLMTREDYRSDESLLLNIGYAYYYKGDIDSAVKFQHKSLEVAQEHDDEWYVCWALCSLAELYYSQDELDSCEVYASRALATASVVDDASMVNWASMYGAALRARQDDYLGGVAKLMAEIEDAEANNLPENEVLGKRLLGKILIDSGREKSETARGSMLLQEALALAKENHYTHEIKLIGEIMDAGKM